MISQAIADWFRNRGFTLVINKLRKQHTPSNERSKRDNIMQTETNTEPSTPKNAIFSLMNYERGQIRDPLQEVQNSFAKPAVRSLSC